MHEEGGFDDKATAAGISKIGKFLTTLSSAPLVVNKDLQITMLSDVWFEAARRARFDIATVIAVRQPQETIGSWSPHARISPELASALWLKYNLAAERHTRGVPRVFVECANVLEDWRRETKRISAALMIDLDTEDEDAIEEFLTPDLRHQRHRGPVSEFLGTDSTSAVYEALSAAARDEPWDRAGLDRVFEMYRASEYGFRTAFEDYRSLDNRLSLRQYAISLVRVARMVRSRVASLM
ncbi:sulfotransferase family protein [Mycolicibacterium celeriflavum]|uniref:sulfotransferase family protein n=1 Tax=Mycolicibacterium celeriflavum TaxID=1249101 RepID=UPI003CEFAB97